MTGFKHTEWLKEFSVNTHILSTKILGLKIDCNLSLFYYLSIPLFINPFCSCISKLVTDISTLPPKHFSVSIIRVYYLFPLR